MKTLLPFCLALCLASSSCERHAELKREIATLDAAVKQDNAIARQCEADIARLGGGNALGRIAEQTDMYQARLQPLTFGNAAKERKWSAIETQFATLKPAAEAYKAAQPK